MDNIPSKSTPEGFKIWVLANTGVVLDWMYHAKGDQLGPVDLDDFWTVDLGFSKTQAVALDLVSQQGVSSDFQHMIWLDNLSISWRLLCQLKKEGFGAAGTVRISKTAREKIEEKDGSTQQQKAITKEQNRGLDPLLSSLQKDHAVQIQWGQIYLISDGEVLQAAWKDQNIVLFMTTVSIRLKRVLCVRRHPPATATNARTSREVFGDGTTKALFIPVFIDDYNHFMGAVDHNDQLGSYYNTQRKPLKNWKPLWHFLLDTSITNCYQMHHHRSPERDNNSMRRYSQKEFLTKLAIALFDRSERLASAPPPVSKPLTHYVRPDLPSEHHHIVLSKEPGACVACRAMGRRPAKVSPRKPLEELQHNIQRFEQELKGRKPGRRKTRYGYDLCIQYVCRKGSC